MYNNGFTLLYYPPDMIRSQCVLRADNQYGIYLAQQEPTDS